MNKIEQFVLANQSTKSALLEVKAQLQLDKYKFLKAKNDLRYSKLVLQQIMNVPIKDSIHLLYKPSDSLNTPLFSDTAITKLPEIEKLELNI